MLFRLIIDDVGLQREADKIGLCSDTGSTSFVLNNTSSQPIRFWSDGSPAAFSLITGTASAATTGSNAIIRDILEETGDPGNFVLAGEAIAIDIGPQQFVWDFDADLTLTVTAVSTAGAFAFNKAKKWWSGGSKVRAAVVTCASAAIEQGATVQDMDDVMQALLLDGTSCAAKVQAASGAVDEDTVLQRADRFQSTLGKAKAFVKKIEWSDVVGRIIARALRR